MATGRQADYADQTPSLWPEALFAEAESLTFWHRFEGMEGSGSPIIRKDELTREPGDTVKMDIVLALTGAGQTGDSTFVAGNEEKLVFRQTSVALTYLHHGVAWTRYGAKVITHDLRTKSRLQLAKWLAAKLDGRVWDELTGAGTTIPTKNKWFSGTATSRDTVADTDAGGRMTLDTITELKAVAQTDLKIEPIRLEDGNEYFGLALHPYAILALKRNDTKWAQAQREAQVRGDDNPLFTGAAGVWDGVILHSSQRVPWLDNANSPVIKVADNVFFGAQALSRAYGFWPTWYEEGRSYGQEQGVMTEVAVGEKANIFDLTAAGGASDANKTAIGHMLVHSAAVKPAA